MISIGNFMPCIQDSLAGFVKMNSIPLFSFR
jgi:hypothetical protein